MVSKVIRRIHMYLALFLSPWMLMYGLSTMAMNHRDFFRDYYNGRTVRWEKETEAPYTGTHPPNAKRWMVAEQLLHNLDLEGTYVARGSLENHISVTRNDPITPRRITYWPKENRYKIEKQIFHTAGFLERMHRRRGYQHKYVLEDTWAFSVDLVILSMVFWVGSGLWLWWELKLTRLWGTVSLCIGIGLFALFLSTI